MVPLETRCIPGRMDSRRIGSLLRQYDGVRVLHLGDAPRMWGGWHDTSVSLRQNETVSIDMHGYPCGLQHWTVAPMLAMAHDCLLNGLLAAFCGGLGHVLL